MNFIATISLELLSLTMLLLYQILFYVLASRLVILMSKCNFYKINASYLYIICHQPLHYVQRSRLTIVSRDAKKKQAIRDE